MCAAKKAKKKRREKERGRRKKKKRGKEERRRKQRNIQRAARARVSVCETVGDLKMISTVGQSEGSLAQRKPEMKMEMPTAMTMQIARGDVGMRMKKIANARME